MAPSLLAFLQLIGGLLGIGVGLGGLGRLRRGNPPRGPGDRLSCWGLIVFGLLTAILGGAQLAGLDLS